MARAKAKVEQKEQVVEDQSVKKSDPITDEVRKAFTDAVAAEKSEDEIKINMIAAGAKFKNVTRIFNELMVEAGLAISKEDKDKIVSDACAEVDLSTEEGFDAAVAKVNGAIESTNEKGAATMIRAYARKNKIEFYKKPKKEGGTRTTFLSDFYAALLENPSMTEEEAHQFIVDHGTANTLRWEKSHQKVRQLANDLVKKLS
jgi:hypothetical protein